MKKQLDVKLAAASSLLTSLSLMYEGIDSTGLIPSGDLWRCEIKFVKGERVAEVIAYGDTPWQAAEGAVEETLTYMVLRDSAMQ